METTIPQLSPSCRQPVMLTSQPSMTGSVATSISRSSTSEWGDPGSGGWGRGRGAETTNYPAVPEASSPRCHDTTTTKWHLWCNPCAPSTASSTSPSPCSQPSLTLFSEYEPGELAAGNKGWWACGMGWGGFLVICSGITMVAAGWYWSVTRLASLGGRACEGKGTCLQVDDSVPTSLPVCPLSLQLTEGVGAALVGGLSSPIAAGEKRTAGVKAVRAGGTMPL